MTKPKLKTTFKPGDAISTEVKNEHIQNSDPCNKDNCMLSRAFVDLLVKTYGGNPGDHKVRSTNHGVSFQLKGRRYIGVFDTKTAFRIFEYDRTYRATHSKEKARATVRPFKARIMIEFGAAVIKWPAMSEETKKKLRALPPKEKTSHAPKRAGGSRNLSL